jgi:hypothetical protein
MENFKNSQGPTYTILLLGLASGKKWQFVIDPSDAILKLSLMEYLIKNQIPVASSCFGEGVCQKCQTADGILSCQLSLKNIMQRLRKQKKYEFMVKFSYL